MTEQMTKFRERAETAFNKTQSQFMARERMISEDEATTIAREEKTTRLRELRLQRELEESLKPKTKAKPAARRPAAKR